jgi:hypothetical protein
MPSSNTALLGGHLTLFPLDFQDSCFFLPEFIRGLRASGHQSGLQKLLERYCQDPPWPHHNVTPRCPPGYPLAPFATPRAWRGPRRGRGAPCGLPPRGAGGSPSYPPVRCATLMVTLGLGEPSQCLALGQVVTFAQGPLPSFALYNSFTVPRYLPDMPYRLPFSPAAPLGEASLYYPASHIQSPGEGGKSHDRQSGGTLGQYRSILFAVLFLPSYLSPPTVPSPLSPARKERLRSNPSSLDPGEDRTTRLAPPELPLPRRTP